MTEIRKNPETGREQIYLKLGNLPGIWVNTGLCDDCAPFGKCLGKEKANAKLETLLQTLLNRGQEQKAKEIEQLVEAMGLEACSGKE